MLSYWPCYSLAPLQLMILLLLIYGKYGLLLSQGDKTMKKVGGRQALHKAGLGQTRRLPLASSCWEVLARFPISAACITDDFKKVQAFEKRRVKLRGFVCFTSRPLKQQGRHRKHGRALQWLVKLPAKNKLLLTPSPHCTISVLRCWTVSPKALVG